MAHALIPGTYTTADLPSVTYATPLPHQWVIAPRHAAGLPIQLATVMRPVATGQLWPRA